MNCPRCGRPAPDEDLRRFSGVCLTCAYAFAAEEDPPELPNLEIVATIGRGGMGVVYKAVQKHLGRPVAVKVLAPRFAGDADFTERFLREARTLAQLSHPGIVAIHDAAVHEGTPYLVMEFVEGESLRRLQSRGRLAPSRAASIVVQVCEALQFAHAQGVVHRDIKPENILIDPSGRAKLADFGLAKLDQEDGRRLTRSGALMGTPAYMAPEQLESPGSVDARTDLYALGVVFYEMLTGSLPLGRFKPPSALAAVDASFDETVLRLLEKDPGQRYPTAAELRAGVEGLATASSRPTVVQGPEVEPRRSRALIAIVVAFAAIGLAALALLVWEFQSGPGEGWTELAGSASGEGVSRGCGPSGFAALAVDARGNPALAWDGGSGAKPEIYFRRFRDQRWEDLDGSGSGGGVSNNAGMSQEPSLALDASGRPVVAWRDDTSGNWEIYLRRWNGERWEELAGSGSAGGVSSTPGPSWSPSVQVDAEGHPVVAWHDGTSGRFQIYLRRWDGAHWGELGGSASGAGLSRRAGQAQYPRLALAPGGRPVVAWHDFSEAGQSIHLLQWDGTTWTGVGSSDGEGGVSGPGELSIGSLSVDPAGRPAVTWVDKAAKTVHFRRWTGTEWQDPGNTGAAGLGRTRGAQIFSSMAFDGKGNPVVAWMDESPGNAEIYLRRWDGTSWMEAAGSATGGGISRTPGESASPRVAVDAEGCLFVSWHDLTPAAPAIYIRHHPGR